MDKLRKRYGPIPLPNEQRFWRFVKKTNACWLWTGYRLPRGYGQFTTRVGKNKKKTVLAHRYAYRLLIGPIPRGKVLDHIKCDNPPCVKPWHLKPSTQRANILRGNSISAVHSRQTRCKRGHEFSPENTYWWGKKGRRLGRHC